MGKLRRGHLLALLAVVGLTSVATIGRSADDDLGLGSGKDGALVANAADTVVNKYAAVTAAAAVGATQVTLAATDDFAVGDVVMIVQMRGGNLASTTTDPPAALDLAAVSAGQYDLVKVTAKNATQVTVSPALKNAYAATGAQAVRVPQYTTVGVPDATSLTAKAWDGTTGGVLAFLATGTITTAGSGTIHANAKGFRGGTRSNLYCLPPCAPNTMGAGDADDPTCNQGRRGESFDGRPEAYGLDACGVGARGTGGGGGGHINAGGAGGGNGGPGGRGGNGWNNQEPYGGYPGAAVDASLRDRLTLGGGGGGGQQNNSPAPDDPSDVGRGGAGGGVVLIRGLSLDAAGAIEANGQRGFDGASDGAGGGGAGGSVIVRTVLSATCTAVRANGGNGGDIGGHGPGGAGGAGRVRIDSRSGTCPAEAIAGAIGAGHNDGVAAPGSAPRNVPEDGGTFGCALDAGACPTASPVCDATIRVCRKCAANAECATNFCATDGTCQTPPAPDASTSSSSSSSSGGSSSGSTSSSSSGGSSGTSSGGVDSGAPAPQPEATPSTDGGACSCRTAGNHATRSEGWLLAALGAVTMAFRRRRRAG